MATILTCLTLLGWTFIKLFVAFGIIVCIEEVRHSVVRKWHASTRKGV